MSRRYSNFQSRRYSDRQAHLHTRHQALQILVTCYGIIQNELRRTSTNLLQACIYTKDLIQSKFLGNTIRELNNSIQNLANLTHDIANFRQILAPFNTFPFPPNSRSRSRSSDRLTSTLWSDSSNSLNLLDNYNEKFYKRTIEGYTLPLPRLTYTPTTYREVPTYQFSKVRPTIDPIRLSE